MDCTSNWSIPFSGTKRWVPFDPDMNATYWYYAVTREESDTTGFRFHGQFAHARYQAYNVYNDETKDLVWGEDSTNISALSDVNIVPDPGNNNPFLLAVPRDTPDRDYTVWVVPEGADPSGLTNLITFPASVTQLSIFLRVYLPDENTGLLGGVPLPAIESFDTATGAPAPCLPTRNIFQDLSGGGSTAPNPGANTDGQVRFYRLDGGGLYPNEDSAYLATIFKEIGDSVAVIRLKPPTFTDTSDPAGIIPAQAMTRYWSFNVYSIKLTNVTACLADYQAVVAEDGFVYVVLGRRTPELLAKTEGMNFLPWGAHDEILFVYRNITPNAQFPYSAAAVPIYSADETAPAETFIGEYAPIGVYMTEKEFLKSDPSRLFERNPPWFPSLMAFEHYDSGRSHLFPLAEFGGSFDAPNLVTTRSSSNAYPTPYNTVYLGPDEVFVYGGGYGDVEGGTGAFVAKVDPQSLEPVWHTRLIDTDETNEWNYPGVLSALRDGFLYQIYGYRLAKLDPRDGRVIGTVELPTLAAQRDTSYNGLDALPDGTLIAKTVYREAGCDEQGFSAFVNCTDPANVPNSLVVAVDPRTMQVTGVVEAPEFIGGRLTATRFQGKDYVYLAGTTTAFRYLYADGQFTLDESWDPGPIYEKGQTSGTAMVVMNDWVVLSTNAAPAERPLSVIAINQSDATQQFSTQPFAEFKAPPKYPRSLCPSAVSVDAVHQRIYALDAGPGRIGALELRGDGLHTVWTEPQRTLEFLALIGPPDRRVLAGTELPPGQPLTGNTTSNVVWRDAATGRELARTANPLPAISTGSMVEPYYGGKMLYLAREGAIVELAFA
ncbi:MAG TPA: hypothetical protein VKB93_21540 [Thermoanaerobaculia bacterium]|nr:hypothetical protein [Thermoanaerobaculia bacterium]